MFSKTTASTPKSLNLMYTQTEPWKFREYFMFSHKCSAMNHVPTSASEVELSGEAFLPFLVLHDASAVEPKRRKKSEQF